MLGVATAVVILGASIVPFLAPPVVRFEQDRAGVGQLTGWPADSIGGVTASILGDLVLWTGDFTCCVDGPRILDDRERQHMLDVRRVFTGLWFVVLVGGVILALAFRRARGTEARAAAWRAVANGARVLAVVIVVLGAFALVAFDAAFEVFHQVFFPAGSYSFDPATSRLVQLFPEQFWSEIAVAVGVVVLGVSIVTAWQAGLRSRGALRVAA